MTKGHLGYCLSSAFVEPFAAWMDRPGMIVGRYLVESATLISFSSSPRVETAFPESDLILFP